MRTKPEGRVGAVLPALVAFGQIAVDVERERLCVVLFQIVSGCRCHENAAADRDLEALHDKRVHGIPQLQRHARIESQRLEKQSVRNVNRFFSEVLVLGIAVAEQGRRFGLDAPMDVGTREQFEKCECQSVPGVDRRNQGHNKRELRVCFREELRIACV